MGKRLNIPPSGAQLVTLKIIPGDNGDVMHALKATEDSFLSFGEAYFSTVKHNRKKGWKRHKKMTLNIVVPVGAIGFVLYDDRTESFTRDSFFEVVLSRENYQRLTIPPGIWVAFYGVGEQDNMLLNIGSIPHDPAEADTLPLENDHINYHWK